MKIKQIKKSDLTELSIDELKKLYDNLLDEANKVKEEYESRFHIIRTDHDPTYLLEIKNLLDKKISVKNIQPTQTCSGYIGTTIYKVLKSDMPKKKFIKDVDKIYDKVTK